MGPVPGVTGRQSSSLARFAQRSMRASSSICAPWVSGSFAPRWDCSRRLRSLVADLSIDKTILQEALRKKSEPGAAESGVQWAREAYRLPERRACRALGVSLSSVRYPSVKSLREPLRERCVSSPACGYARLWIMLRRNG